MRSSLRSPRLNATRSTPSRSANRRCAQRLGQDAGTAVVMDGRSPSPRSSRGFSTLCHRASSASGTGAMDNAWITPPTAHGFERGDVCFGGWSPMAAVVGGVRHPLPAAPRVNGGRYRGQGVGNRVSGVPRAGADAACRAPTKTEHRPIQKRTGPAPNIALFMRRRSAARGPRRSWRAGPRARPLEEVAKGDVPPLGGADPGEYAPALKRAMFGRGAPRPRPRRRILLTYTVVPSSLLPSAGPQR